MATVVYTNKSSQPSVINDLLNFFEIFSLFNAPEILTVLFIFNFLQLLILSIISELIWPTHIFNRQNNIGQLAYRLRTYTEYLVKLRNYTNKYKIFNKFLVK